MQTLTTRSRTGVDSPFAAIPPPPSSISNLYIIHGNQPGNEPNSPEPWNLFRRRTRGNRPVEIRDRSSGKSISRHGEETRRRETESSREEAPRFVLGFSMASFRATDRQTIRRAVPFSLPVLSGAPAAVRWSANKTLARGWLYAYE